MHSFLPSFLKSMTLYGNYYLVSICNVLTVLRNWTELQLGPIYPIQPSCLSPKVASRPGLGKRQPFRLKWTPFQWTFSNSFEAPLKCGSQQEGIWRWQRSRLRPRGLDRKSRPQRTTKKDRGVPWLSSSVPLPLEGYCILPLVISGRWGYWLIKCLLHTLLLDSLYDIVTLGYKN